MSHYKFTGTDDPQFGTTEIVLSRDEDGEATRTISVNEVAEIDAETLEKLKGHGMNFEEASGESSGSSPKTSSDAEPVQQPGEDVVRAEPSVNEELAPAPNQSGKKPDQIKK